MLQIDLYCYEEKKLEVFIVYLCMLFLLCLKQIKSFHYALNQSRFEATFRFVDLEKRK